MNVCFDLNGVASSCFEDCPFCGSKTTFGVLLVSGQDYTRKCGSCHKSKCFELPLLSKKVIYLDQFAFSNMMKEIDSSRVGKPLQHHGNFFLELFKQLDRLGKLQLIVCPRSSIHFNESIVAHDDYQKIRAVYDLLSRGSKFNHHQNIYTQQILGGLQAWLQGKDTFEINLNPARAIAGSVVTDWDGWFRISANLPVNEEAIANELRASQERLHNGLAPIIARWQQEPAKKFDDWYAEEVAANGEALIRCWLEYDQTATAVYRGELPTDSFPNLNYPVRLMLEIFHRLKMPDGVQNTERIAKAREFFASNIFRQIPAVSIGAAMWAGLAHRFHNGQKDWKASIANDITAISTHLPFCDAMFLENECANLVTNNPVKKYITYKTRIFSLRTKDEFLSYLKGIEASASKEHLQKVHEIYGKFWPMPFSKLKPRNLPT